MQASRVWTVYERQPIWCDACPAGYLGILVSGWLIEKRRMGRSSHADSGAFGVATNVGF